MRIYKKESVLEASRNRIAWLFDEFPNVVVSVSGGKDSTVVLELVLEEARRRDRLPLKVLWLDQEAEYQATVDTVREIMYREEVEPYWIQVPMRMFNATSFDHHWLHAWDPEAKEDWVHPQDPIAITGKDYGTDRFGKMFKAIAAKEWPDEKTVMIAGVRCEESPSRAMGLTSKVTYKHATWGKVIDLERQHFTMYPIYDWSYTDVWKAIHEHGWKYNPIYDYQYRWGYSLSKMRVSALCHETSLHHLEAMQEVEPVAYDRLVRRLPGIHSTSRAGEDFYIGTELPFMFESWEEYRDYLLENLTDEEYRPKIKRWIDYMDRQYPESDPVQRCRTQINCILTNDHEGVKAQNWRAAQYMRRSKNRSR